jgi:hypothetical protein
VAVRFVDITARAFGTNVSRWRGPVAVLDYNHDDRNSLFVAEGTNGFRLLANQGGAFTPLGEVLPADPGGAYRQVLVGDLNNDRFEDLVVLGEKTSLAFRLATNALIRDATAASGLKNLRLAGQHGGLLDLDFTGKLDLLAVASEGSGVRVLRNLGMMYYRDMTATSGVPANLNGLRQVAIDDWNNDDLLDVFVSRVGQRPLYLQKQRGGPLVPTELPPGQLAGTALALGDVNGDSRADLLVGAPDHVDLLLGGINQFLRLPMRVPGLTTLKLLDYDNDGWLDLIAAGDGVRVWRNLGDGKFADMTAKLGLDKLGAARVIDVVAADLDQDGDTDLVFDLAGQSLQVWRNDGGNANAQLKVRLWGNRSNASGLGIRVEASAGPFRIHRTVSTLPVEIGVGRHTKIEALTTRWFDLPFSQIDVKPETNAAVLVPEPVLPTGSCPYLYVWDGQRFRFVSDFLCSAPVGLRVSDTVFAEADPLEYVWLGDAASVRPRDGEYVLQITEELREVLYLDEAKLVAVDHPPGTEVHTTGKFLPGKPFPPAQLWTLEKRRPLRQATRLDGSDVTESLTDLDGRMLSPARLRVPQLRGLAEPHGVVLDFGPLPTNQPLVLALTGWLRLGGGMANVAASHDPNLPFPFPRLEVEVGRDQWRPVEVMPGTPPGKTKTILVDLERRLPAGSERLRLTTAFEIHWDRIALFHRRRTGETRLSRVGPSRADLHWRGFSHFADLPWTFPLTPVYERVFQNAPWVITPMGWCTRYGAVDPLLEGRDNAMVLVNGGDELTLAFPADRLPPAPAGTVRDFFLEAVGWDKDADFHVELGWKVDPVPWHGMEDQRYGQETRPAFPSDALMARFNTRWVGQHTLRFAR